VKYLFVHQNFPGQYLHIVRHLAARKQHEVVFITEPNANQIEGVRKVPYRKPPGAAADTHIAARELDAGARRAEVVARTAANLKSLGFTPDIIIGHHGWGELLNLIDVWPGVPLLGYFEFYYHYEGIDVNFDPEFPAEQLDFPRIRAKNAINHLALTLGCHGQTPTEWQHSTYPAWAQPQINLLREGVHLDVCKPNPQVRRAPLKIGAMTIRPADKLVTYVSRDLEPYRGFHIMMRTLPHLLRARKDVKVVMVGGDGVSYGNPPQQGTWREVMMKEVGDRIDPDRIVFPGRLEYQTYVTLLQRSDAHVYLTYPFVASWSLREALAMGCAVIGSDTQPVREFITPGENGLLASFFDPQALARTIQRVLEETKLARSLRENARAYAERHLAMNEYLAKYDELIARLVSGAAMTRTAAAAIEALSRPQRRARR
jgi:glycosyltransferase involved in cell wall biosynthesis